MHKRRALDLRRACSDLLNHSLGWLGHADRCPICCILPPHMVDEVIKNGDEDDRSFALETLRASEQFRGRRQTVAQFRGLVTPTGEKRRTVYDAKQGQKLPGTIIRSEGGPPSGDPAVDEAYDGAGATYDFFKEIFERTSIDGEGLRLDSTVHYDKSYNNAFWNGTQMVYGDGDGRMFERFTKSIDVIGHELTHGITQYEAALVYQGEPGAINESMSDVFGIMVKQYALKQKATESNWIIGEGLFTSKIKGEGIRSMKAPGTAYNDPVLGKDPQPDNVSNLYKGRGDNGGVHINSGIPNRAFYIAATEMGGYAWEKAGKIWYIALRDRLRSRANFRRMATITLSVTTELYGGSGAEYKAVEKGWKTVGVL
jgi:Zn-dependent metalloprotease